MLDVFADTVQVLRVSHFHVIVRGDGSFRMIIVYRVIECFELSGHDIEIPVRHSDSLESKFHFVISFLYFLVQLVKFGYILPESRETYVIAVFVFLERYAQNIAILP